MEDPGTSTAGSAVTAIGALRAGWSWRTTLVVVLLVSLFAAAGNRAVVWHRAQQDATRDRAAIAAATVEVERLITISASTSREDVALLLDGATAGFRSELESEANELRRALSANKVTATGQVVSSGLMKLDGTGATVLVAATGSVKNKAAGAGQPRSYRLRVDLQRTGGRWLVSGLEFVA